MSSTVRSTYWGPNTQFAIKTFPEQRALAEQRGWKVEGQEEKCPTTGKIHYQFWVKTPQVRMSEVKKMFAGAHIEVARNVKAVQQYCAKSETRSGALPQASDKYPTQDKLFDLWAIRLNCRMKMNPRCKFYISPPRSGDQWLRTLDLICEDMIHDGYRVESLAVNPAVRSAIKKFGSAIYDRHISATLAEEDGSSCAGDSQTVRQPEIFSQTVCIPTIDADSVSTRNHSAEGTSSDGASSSGQDYEDSECSTDEGDSQGTSADGGEASDGTCDTE